MENLKVKSKKEEDKLRKIIKNLEKYLLEFDTLQSSFDYVRLNIASSEKIDSWSKKIIWKEENNAFVKDKEFGRILNSETVHFRDFSPIQNGLFCESIFGPTEDWLCRCKKISGFYPDMVCPNCYVELTDSRVRRYRMGKIELEYPVAHAWFLKGRPCYLGEFLNSRRYILEHILYYKIYFGQHFTFRHYFKKDRPLLFPFFVYAANNPMYSLYMYHINRRLSLHAELNEKHALFWIKLLPKLFPILKKLLENAEKRLQAFPSKEEIENMQKRFRRKSDYKKVKASLKRKYKKLNKEKLFWMKSIAESIRKLTLAKWDLQRLYSFEGPQEEDFSFVISDPPSIKLEESYNLPLITKRSFLLFLQEIKGALGQKILVKDLYKVVSRFNKLTKNYELSRAYLASSYTTLKEGTEKKLMKSLTRRYGGEIVFTMLEDFKLEFEIALLRDSLLFMKKTQANYKRKLRKLRILESFLATKTSPTSLMLNSLPVLPPTLRPLVELDDGNLISADINEVYRIILIRSLRLLEPVNIVSEFIDTGRHTARLIQEAVDSLIDNTRLPKNKTMLLNNRPLKTLTEILEGKEGRFRQTLLGKRVDYSARSVIVVSPELKINQCGIPYSIARVLFEAFLVQKILEFKTKKDLEKETKDFTRRLAILMVRENKPFIWPLLFQLSQKYSVLLNRAPTLHKFGIQAFDPLIILGDAIQLHPLVCSGFNADFDGDQMAVHLPLYEASQLEVKSLLKPSHNILSPANGELILKPSQDIVIGSYYLTFLTAQQKRFIPYCFGSPDEVLNALFSKKIDLHTRLLLRYSMKNLPFYEKDNYLYFSADDFPIFEKKVHFYQVIQSFENTFYFLTNLGIIIGRKFVDENFILTDIFLDTSPGRIIFGLALEKAKQSYLS